jgi:hypothetical protein
MLHQIEQRIKELAAECEASAARHNGLVGALFELKQIYQKLMENMPAIENIASDVVEVVDGVTEVIDAMEHN